MFFDKYYNEEEGFYNFFPTGKEDAHTEALNFITSHPRETWRGWLGNLCDELLTIRGHLWPEMELSDKERKEYCAKLNDDELFDRQAKRLDTDGFLLYLIEDAFFLFGIRLPKDFFKMHPEADSIEAECWNIYPDEDTEGETMVKTAAPVLHEEGTEEFANLAKWRPSKKLPQLDKVCVFLINDGVIPDGTTGEYLLQCVLHAHFSGLFAASKKAKFLSFVAYLGGKYFNKEYEKEACRSMGVDFRRLRKRKEPDFVNKLARLL